MSRPVLREMRVADVPAVMAVQEPASIARGPIPPHAELLTYELHAPRR